MCTAPTEGGSKAEREKKKKEREREGAKSGRGGKAKEAGSVGHVKSRVLCAVPLVW